MQIFGRSILFLFCSMVSYYLTWSIDKITLETRMQFTFIFLYFLVTTLVVCWLLQKRLPKFKLKQIATRLSASCFLATIILVICFDFFIGLYQPMTIEVTALGSNVELKEGQKGTEVWLNHVIADNKIIDISAVNLPKGWENREGALLSFQNQPSTVVLDLPAVKKVKLRFLSHPWSGIVKIDNGNKLKQLELFSPDMSGSYIDLQLNGIEKHFNTLENAILVASCFLMLAVVIYFLIGLLLPSSRSERLVNSC